MEKRVKYNWETAMYARVSISSFEELLELLNDLIDFQTPEEGFDKSLDWCLDSLARYAEWTVNRIVKSANFAFESLLLDNNIGRFDYIDMNLSKFDKIIKSTLISLYPITENVSELNNDILNEYQEYLDKQGIWFTGDIEVAHLGDTELQGLRVWATIRETPFFYAFYAVELCRYSLQDKFGEETGKLMIRKEIATYKPTKEQQLETYFACDNPEALKSILGRDLRGKIGKGVAMVLVALEKAGYVMIGDFKPLFEKILSPLYGVRGSRQAVTDQIARIKEITESSNPKTAKQIAKMAENYKIILQ